MENDVYELVQVQNTSMNSIPKQKKHKGSNIKLGKLYDTKARNKKFNKSTTRSDDNYGKTRLRQNLYGFKKENTQRYDRQNKRKQQ